MLPIPNHQTEQEDLQGRATCEVADIFRHYGEEYRLTHLLPPSHLKVMHDIEVCRTAYLGGHLEKCDLCGFEKYSYNSCRNRHCPKCQSLTKARWLEARKAEVLPVAYFHNVFTLPHEINPIALCNKKIVFTILFKAASETLLEFGRNPQNGLGGKAGFIAILHTWDQTLMDHVHLHCVIPSGALSCDDSQWINAKKDFLFPVKALSKVFRGKFMQYLEKAFENGTLIFPGNTGHLGTPEGFSHLKKQLWEKNWVVYSKKPFAGPEQVLDYIGRYTHRVAISNHRIIALEKHMVSFYYRDRKNKNSRKIMTLDAYEFIRRFLLHVLPKKFMRIRHFGFLANRSKKQNLKKCRELLGLSPQLPESAEKTTQELMLQLTGINLNLCPRCQKGSMIVIAELLPLSDSISNVFCTQPVIHDSS
jgi:hypothetical protein